ncbi:uncharacterized protein LOC126686817 [Mercurialis annua]|uniref:uncharacterized protein LOC126686817 n=1 Tax=Mercurialis annua TaxID=3986 RepID=UPI00216102AD|nr:uncharacterized protein LOC126686817 [Mercurialis annua]
MERSPYIQMRLLFSSFPAPVTSLPSELVEAARKIIQQEKMEATGNNQPPQQPPPAAISSCRKKKSEQANFLEDVKDHVDEFIHASMDEHKSCFKKTIGKMFGMSKIVAEREAESKGVESSLPLRTVVSD